MTDEQILELGFKALVDKLGPVGMVRFIHQFQFRHRRLHQKNGSNGSACPMLKTLAKQIPTSWKTSAACAAKTLKTIIQ